ncbi:MAG: transglycosylase SLT domain-containing protein [Alteromonas stellipolaris]|uniref:transglycosylase SLT domain-containing protein n=1 Tax=Alteromonas stellipolaris TaxID=233316 RepID=UPI003B8D6569
MDKKIKNRLNRLADMLCDGASGVNSKGDSKTADEAMISTAEWLNTSDIQGVGVATKVSGNEDTGKPCITIYVNRKKPLDEVSTPIPNSFKFSNGEVVYFDVEEIGELEAQSSFKEHIRPVFSGLSVAHHDRPAGTLGLIVRSKLPPYRHFVMSCAHVIAPYRQSNEYQVYQPCKPNDSEQSLRARIGKFVAAIPLNYSPQGYPNYYDVALAELSENTPYSTKIPYVGVLKGVSARISQNMLIKAIGMVSGRTSGQVINPNFRARINYYDAQGNRKTAGFQRVVLCTQYGEAGDSGAAILNSKDKLVGMHIGGSSSHSVFCRIIPALNQFGVWPITESATEVEANSDSETNFTVATPDYLPTLVEPHSIFNSSPWYLTPSGLLIDNGVNGSPGELVTVPSVIEKYDANIKAASESYQVPYELIVATICTESGGNPELTRQESSFVSDHMTPHRVSTGLMQTLISTARESLGDDAISREQLMQPDISIRAGTAYIKQQFHVTAFDPPRVACAYNAGGIYRNDSANNRWKMRQYPIGTSKHADRFVMWFNDCFRYFAESNSMLPECSLYRQLNE